MTDPNRERLHAEMDEPFVVFLVGMRINSFWRVWEWLPVLLAMPRMLRELADDDAMLGSRTKPGLRNWMVVQYWRSFEELTEYARDDEAEHLPAWSEYNEKRAASGAVGIWHETYVVGPGDYETVYNNVPPQGLGEAAPLVPATGRRESAAGRLTEDADDSERDDEP
ncbi:DUF4188 domain-containing protein [Halorussus caseinilyticus]|uniref:DUF4188 domain-containing protein n=1 Tax=Halorussus caseinilyticus TaxID=3034025 RepID=A0ABD5WH57_9EURY|nr:DUF4188 domain-containing protein [Halorussus sp. DT72]